MTPDQFTELTRQHVEILAQLERLWTMFAALVLLGLCFLGSMLGAAAWSVRAVNKRQEALESKFLTLINVLLEKERGQP